MKLASLLLITALGCAKQSSGPLTMAEAMSAGQALGSEVEDGATGFGPVSQQGASVDSTCVTLSGDTGDPDADNIPNHATLTFNCSAMALGVTTTVTGTETVTDTQPNVAAWAFTADANLHGTVTAGQASVTTDRTGTITATQGSPLGPFNLERALNATTVIADRTTSVTVDEVNGWTLAFSPQATWTPGGVVVTGSLSASGSWDVTVGSNSAEATLATTTPLTLDPSCATRVTGGSLTGTYTGGTITVAWSACGTSNVTVSSR